MTTSKPTIREARTHRRKNFKGKVWTAYIDTDPPFARYPIVVYVGPTKMPRRGGVKGLSYGFRTYNAARRFATTVVATPI